MTTDSARSSLPPLAEVKMRSPTQQHESKDLYDCTEASEMILQRNPFDFDTCCELIDYYVSINDLAQARHYREHAACFCATTEEFWIEWIHHELELGPNNTNSRESNHALEEEQHCRSIIQLFKRAVTAVPQVELWLEYLKFLKIKRFQGGRFSAGTTAAGGNPCSPFVTNAIIRRACEHALKEVGLHPTEGPKLWSFYRKFEVQLLNVLLEQNGVNPNSDQITGSISFPSTPTTVTKSVLEPLSIESLKGTHLHITQYQRVITTLSASHSHPFRRKSPRSSVAFSLPSHQSSDQLLDASDGANVQVPESCSSHEVSRPSTQVFKNPNHHDPSSRIVQQVNRVRSLFCRQMTLPLAGLPDLFDEYRIFEAELPDSLQATEPQIEFVRSLYQEQGMYEWDLRKPYEMQLSVTSEDKFETLQKLSDAWTSYISYEKSVNVGSNHERVNITYLRACEDLGHIRLDLWYQWISWVINTMEDPGRGAIIFDRAVRYHPEESALWLGYIQCQLRKTTHPDPDRIRQVFLRGLRGLSQQSSEKLLQFTFIAADCLWRCVKYKMLMAEIQSEQQCVESDASRDSVGTTNLQSSVALPPSETATSFNSSGSSTLPKRSMKEVLPALSSSACDASNINLANTIHNDHCVLVRDVFLKTERHLISLLFMNENGKPLKAKNHVDINEDDVLSGLLTLWDKWCTIEAKMLKDDQWVERVAARLLLAYSVPRIKQIVWSSPVVDESTAIVPRCHNGIKKTASIGSDAFERTLLFDPDALNRLSLSCDQDASLPLSPYGIEWYHVMEVLKETLHNKNDHYPRRCEEIRSLYRLASGVVAFQNEFLFESWRYFEKCHGTKEQQQMASSHSDLTNSIRNDKGVKQTSPCRARRLLIPDSPSLFLARFESTSSTETGESNTKTYDSPAATATEHLSSDSEAVSVTLDQLLFRRGKRRRRLSGSEADGFSDASSDSGGFVSSLAHGGETPLIATSASGTCPSSPLIGPCRKRRRSSASIVSSNGRTGSTTVQPPPPPPPSIQQHGGANGIRPLGQAPSSSSILNTNYEWTSSSPVLSAYLLSPSLSPTSNRPSWEIEDSIKGPLYRRNPEFKPPTSRSRSTSPSPATSRRSSSSCDSVPSNTSLRQRSNSSKSEQSISTSYHAQVLRSDGLPVLSVEDIPLTPIEIDALEKATRATWDGHESADPSLAPPVPPVNSCMSPLRRRSLLNSSSPLLSPLFLPSEPLAPLSHSQHHDAGSPITVTPTSAVDDVDVEPNPNQPHFTGPGFHSASIEDDLSDDYPHHRKRTKDEMTFYRGQLNSDHRAKRLKQSGDSFGGETKQEATAELPPPQMGKHFLQLRQIPTELMQVDTESGKAPLTEYPEELMLHDEEHSTVFISNLDKTVGEQDIQGLLKDCPGLKEIRIVRDFMKRSKGYCYAEFNRPEDATNAINLVHDAILNERQIKVQISRPTVSIYEPKTLFLSQLPLSLEDQVMHMLSGNSSFNSVEAMIFSVIRDSSERILGKPIEAVEIRLQRDVKTGKLKGYGYIDFSTEEDARTMLHVDAEELRLPDQLGSFLLVPSIPMKRHRWTVAPDNKIQKRRLREKQAFEASLPQPEPKTLFVKNLSFKTTEGSLKKHFESCGRIESTMICRDPHGVSKGFGFVVFESDRDAFSGRMLDGSELDGRDIIVSQSHRTPTLPKEVEEPPPEDKPYPDRGPKVRVGLQHGPSTRIAKISADGDPKGVTTLKPLTNAEFRKFL